MTPLFRPFGIGLGVLFIGAFVVVIAASRVPKPVLYMLEFIVGGAPIYLPLLGFILKLWKESKISAEIKEYEKDLENAKHEYEETEAFLKNNAGINIPPRFRQEAALEYIIKGLKAREFITLEQAFFKCEEAMNMGQVPNRYFGD